MNIFLNSSLDFGFSSPSSAFSLFAVKPSGLTFLGTAKVFFPLSWMLSFPGFLEENFASFTSPL
uniref:Uncharacterized protein n=1 Tax=Glycine max TaxID=3847 RepID=C6TN00_SOYBN|nr:unknown [Glycine max]